MKKVIIRQAIVETHTVSFVGMFKYTVSCLDGQVEETSARGLGTANL